jgi:hypothetical protein
MQRFQMLAMCGLTQLAHESPLNVDFLGIFRQNRRRIS